MFARFLNALAFSAALSADAFASGFSYGAAGNEIPLSSAFSLAAVCGGLSAAALTAGAGAASLVSAAAAAYACCAVLAGLGLFKIFTAPADGGRVLLRGGKPVRPPEAAVLGISLSLDALAAGVGAGFAEFDALAVAPLSFLTNAAAVLGGGYLGKRYAARFGFGGDAARLGGLLLLALAAAKLFQ